MVRLIDKIEHTGNQFARWFRVILIIAFIIFIIWFIIGNIKRDKEADAWFESRFGLADRTNRPCLEEIGNQECSNFDSYLMNTFIDETPGVRFFECGNNVRINISNAQFEECSKD